MVLEAQAKASLPIIESCHQMGLRVIAAAPSKYCAGYYCKGVRQRFHYPSARTHPNHAVESILRYLRTHDIEVLFPVGDLITDLIARRQDDFRKCTRLVLPAYNVFVKGRSKIPTLQAAELARCPIPKTWYPSQRGLDEVARIAEYPVLIKPTIGVGARGLTYCENANSLLRAYAGVEKEYGECFVQEFVPQSGMQYKVDCILDRGQQPLAAVAYAKLRYYPPNGGSSVLNMSQHRPDIIENALKVLRQLNWYGFCDFDFITDPRDNVVKLMEINPRYPESYRATVAAGVDMTRIMYDLAMERSPQQQLDYLERRYNRFLIGDIMWFLKTNEDRFRVKPSFFDFFRQDTLYQILRKDNLGPILGYLLENASMLFDKEMREFRLRNKNTRNDR